MRDVALGLSDCCSTTSAQLAATPAGLVCKEAPSTLFAADGTKVEAW